MPSIVQVKKWLFNREFANEYAGFREEFLRLQNIKLYLYYEDLQDKLNNLKHHYIKNKKGLTIIDPKVAKDYRDFFQAIRWYERSLDLLVRLYDYHAQGLDFPIEGIHFDSILSPGTAGPLPATAHPKPSRYDITPDSLNYDYRIRSSITRAEAEALLGTPLLYGRIHKKNHRKPIPRRGVLHTPSSSNEPLRQPTPNSNSNPNSNFNLLHTPSSAKEPLRQPTPNSNPNSNFKPRTGPIPPGLIGTKYASLYHPDPLHYDFDTTSILNLSNEPQDAAPNRKSYIVNRKSVYLSVNEFCNSQSPIRNPQFSFPAILNSS
jgi:hypothetical protein